MAGVVDLSVRSKSKRVDIDMSWGVTRTPGASALVEKVAESGTLASDGW